MSGHNPIGSNPVRAADNDATKMSSIHIEDAEVENLKHRKLKVAGGADTALALLSEPDEINQTHDPAEETSLIRKIDWMILPYLSVCYVFFCVSLALTLNKILSRGVFPKYDSMTD